MPSFYFEQLLQTGLNGIDQQGITAAVLQIAEVILILSLLWSVYEAYSNGGDVRLLGVAAVKYLVLGLVFLNYPSAFRAMNTMFNGVADGVYNLSGGVDVIKAWGNSLSQAWNSNPNWFSSLWNLVTGGASAIERTKNGPWDYVVFGVKEVHKVKSGAEVTDRIVGQYNIRLVEERRSEFNPSGLLVAEYSEQQMVGERNNGLEQNSELDK